MSETKVVRVADESALLSHVGVWAFALLVFVTVIFVESADGICTGLDWFWAILIGLALGLGGEAWLWWLSQRGESNAWPRRS